MREREIEYPKHMLVVALQFGPIDTQFQRSLDEFAFGVLLECP